MHCELQTGKRAEISEVWLNIKEMGGSGSTFCAHVDILSPSVKHSGTATLPLGFALFRGENLLPDCVSSSATTLHELDADRASSQCSISAPGTRARTHPWHVASLALSWAHVDGPHFVSGPELDDADATADRALSRCSTDAPGTRARTHPWHVASLALNWAHVDGPHFVSGPELDDADATADRALSRCSINAAGTRARTHPWHVASLALNWAHVDGPHFVSGPELDDADATADRALSRCSAASA
jgi:hypothetical protein